MVFQFSSKQLSCELTAIKPHPYGQAEALAKEKYSDQFTTIPPLSLHNPTKANIEQAMIPRARAMIDPDQHETRAAFQEKLFATVDKQIRKKLERFTQKQLEVDLLILIDTSLYLKSDVFTLANHLSDIRKRRLLPISHKTVLLFHSQPNNVRFYSFIIEADGTTKTRT